MHNNFQEIWQRALQKIEKTIPRESYLTWFSPLKLLSAENSEIVIGVPNGFFFEFLESHYKIQIEEALRDVSGGTLAIKFKIHQSEEEDDIQEAQPPQRAFQAPREGYVERTHLNPRYVFENFVEGDSNSFANAAALAVAEAPGKTPFNPLFIYGPTGLGKTHLLQAVGNFSLANKRAKRVVFVTSEMFMNDFVFSIKTYKTTDFSRFYRNVDMLLLDDVQFFQGKERTQQEFFHTFNSLHQVGKQIVLTSDRPPKELGDFDKRLISRIGQGLVTDIVPPDFETRLAIIQKRAEREGIFLPEEIAEYISQSIRDNIRDLEGALIKLIAYCSISNADLTLPVAREVLKDMIETSTMSLSIENIQQKVAGFYHVPVDLLIARNRKKEVALARQVAMYFCFELTNSTLKSIGVHFGNRDHSTVIHAKKLITQKLEEDPAFDAEISSIRNLLLSK
ncbi:chromosomal replication initiator protein DnaA [bacterium]|nr:chromosomal replication initiator protein DnaA [bacterium]